MIDLECAETGIPLLPPLPVASQSCQIKPKVKCYQIGDFWFDDYESAERVRVLLNSLMVYRIDYNYQVGYDYKYLKLNDEIMLRESVLFDENQYSTALIKHHTQQKEYEERMKLYRKIADQRQTIVNKILEKIKDAKAELKEYEQKVSEAKRYLELVNGDVEIAGRFFTKVYKDADIRDFISSDDDGGERREPTS